MGGNSGKFYRDKARRQATEITKARSVYHYTREKLERIITKASDDWLGPAGVQGPTGPDGPSGPTSPQGTKANGAAGQAGTNATTGGAGVTATGPAGQAGQAGAAAAKGPDGPTGSTGGLAATGPTGNAGVKGVSGETGNDGVDSTSSGPEGVSGPTSSRTGDTGPDGTSPVGNSGPTGNAGGQGRACRAANGTPASFSPSNPACATDVVISHALYGSDTCKWDGTTDGDVYDMDRDASGAMCSWTCVSFTSGTGGSGGTCGSWSAYCCEPGETANDDGLCCCYYTGGGGVQVPCAQWVKTAIVELFGEYRKLFSVEQPDVRFEDVLVATMKKSEDGFFYIDIDPLFVEACVQGSIDVVGLAPSSPAVIGAEVMGAKIRLSVKEILTHFPKIPTSVRVTISGIRRGFAGARFERTTYEEVTRSRAFWAEHKKIIELARTK